MPAKIAAPLLALMLVVAAVAPTRAASPEQPPCPKAAYASPVEVPEHLVAHVAKAFKVDDSAVRHASYVRCAREKLLGCYVGANLNCFKADTRRTLPGATAWCRDHPGSASIPMFATGHETMYEWSCQGQRPVAGKVATPLDAEGYVARNWKRIR